MLQVDPAELAAAGYEERDVWGMYYNGLTNEFYLLNLEVAENCDNAWLSVTTDCSTVGDIVLSRFEDAVPVRFAMTFFYNFGNYITSEFGENYAELRGKCAGN